MYTLGLIFFMILFGLGGILGVIGYALGGPVLGVIGFFIGLGVQHSYTEGRKGR